MRESKGFSYSSLREKIALKLGEANETLVGLGYKSQQISSKEFFDYMTGETPTGDTITIVDVLDNEYLMMHEVVEISELKQIGVAIDKQTVMKSYPNVVAAHYRATEYELNYAIKKKDYEWLKTRINHAKSWLEEPNMPHHLVRRHNILMRKLTRALKNLSKEHARNRV